MTMHIKCIGSGSDGNCYALISDNEILLLDLGFTSKEIIRECDYRIGDILGAVVTHAHGDHAKSVNEFARLGIPIAKAYECESKQGRWQFGGFTVQSYEVPHDGEPCVGYFIKHGNHKILYATDFEYLPVSFVKIGLTTMIIEANCQSKYIDDEEDAKKNHVLRGHAELQTTVDAIKHNATDSLQNVILCHLSKDNANEQEVIEEVRKVAKNANVSVAKKGVSIEL